MFSHALRSGAAPLRALPRSSISAPAFRNAVASRKVTTDAASSHADKESVPEVCAHQMIASRELCPACFSISTNNNCQADDAPFQVRLSDESFETYELDPPPYTLDTTKEELKKMYYDMVATR